MSHGTPALGFPRDFRWESKVWARDAQEAAKGLRTPLGIHGSSPQSGIGPRKKHPRKYEGKVHRKLRNVSNYTYSQPEMQMETFLWAINPWFPTLHSLALPGVLWITNERKRAEIIPSGEKEEQSHAGSREHG